MDIEYITYLLTKDETAFIAGAMGISRLYGMFDDTSEPDDARLYEILRKLISKNFISCSDDCFVIAPEIRAIIKFMAEAPVHEVYGKGNPTLPVKCIYYSEDKALVCEQSYVSQEDMRFFWLTPKEVRELLREEGYSETEEDDDTD